LNSNLCGMCPEGAGGTPEREGCGSEGIKMP